MVRSVETVVDLLQTHLDFKVNFTSAEVLRLNCKSFYLEFALFEPIFQFDR